MSTVLVSGAGGAAVPGLIRGLQAQGHRVVAVDANPHAAGLYLADAGRVVPFGRSDEFLPVLRRICRQDAVDVVLPLVDEELVKTTELEGIGVTVVLPRRAFVELCLDKWRLMKALLEAGVPVPQTGLASGDRAGLAFPVVAKPRTGRGSRGVAVLQDPAALAGHLDSVGVPAEGMLIQRYVEGPEYTVSVVAWRDGETQAVVPKRVLLKKGITQLAVTEHVPVIDEVCRTIQAQLRADGPFNVQLRIDDQTGLPVVFEINPRFSTTVSLTIAAGIDEPGILVRQALGEAPLGGRQWTPGVVLVRQITDVFLDEAWFQQRARAVAAK